MSRGLGVAERYVVAVVRALTELFFLQEDPEGFRDSLESGFIVPVAQLAYFRAQATPLDEVALEIAAARRAAVQGTDWVWSRQVTKAQVESLRRAAWKAIAHLREDEFLFPVDLVRHRELDLEVFLYGA